MALLHLLSYVGAVAAFVFVTLSLASGLLWLSELIEEHSRVAKTVGQRGIYVIIALHILLHFYDTLPLKHTLFSIVCHIVYLQNFTARWPFISLSSKSFIASCAFVIIDHFLWFFYFARITQDARHRAQRTYRGPQSSQPVPGFADIATFFGICVWLAPLFLFLSLSANDNALPMNLQITEPPKTPMLPSRPVEAPPRASLFKSLFDSFQRVRPRPRRRDTSEGLIAPRSPSMVPSRASTVSPALQRVPSMNNLPPPSPSRRVSSDYGVLIEDESRRLRPMALATPPRRVSVGKRSTADGGLEMRRAASASRNSQS